ncbi:MAG: tetratricopeptide repeat protein, partial [Aeromonadaceae bacterium]
ELLLESLRKHFQPALLPLTAKLQHPGTALTQLVEKLQSQLPETERAATMGFIYLQQKAYAQAQSALEQALQQQPTNRAVLLGLAKTMEQQRLFEKAVYYYQRATANH